jgi:hypothetical protein
MHEALGSQFFVDTVPSGDEKNEDEDLASRKYMLLTICPRA